ncbi:MAG: Txe/YoeB family addiction module toxin [Oscillibacter sp.]|nr:Txe/YoeB family addiction module toxin [Oscillibacter sp.]
MYDLTFSPEAWEDYLYWQTQDKKTLKRINLLIQSIQRDGLSGGLGKPEALRHKDGWSRRIDEKNRLLYVERGNSVYITSFRGHYDD